MNKCKVLLLLMVLLASPVPVWAQTFGSADYDYDWQASFVAGMFTGGTYKQTVIEGENVQLRTDDGLLAGIRISTEQEFFGVELTTAGVFYDADLKADPAADVPSVSDASLFLLSVNGLIFPTGNEIAEGRVRPFITIGPGLAVFFSDFAEADNKAMFDVNVGGGIKFLLGDEGNPVLRLDWRWYYMVGSTVGLENAIYRQELSLGIGYRY